MTEIQRYDGSNWVDIRYQDFEIDFGLSDVLIAPKATVDTDVRETINAGERLRIREDGSTIFEGELVSDGTRRGNGSRQLPIEHKAYRLFDENVSFSVSSPTASDVLQAALDAANIGGDFTLSYSASDPALNNDYEADGRTVKRVFRDITDRTGSVWWVAGATDDITVNDYGARGVWETVDTSTDTARVEKFVAEDLETVANDITVNGTGKERVTGTASDSTSITDYGRQTKTLNVSYVTTLAEANAYADALLQPEPLPKADVRIGANVGTNPEQNLSNYEIDVADTAGTGLDDTLVIEQQTVQQGQVTLQIGKANAVNFAEFNRQSKSREDITEPGSVYDTDRLADNSVDSQQLVDSSVITSKLDDLAVELQKVQDGAIDTVKITDEAVEAPKVLANTLTANEIAADTITANEIVAGTITALEIAADTLTANEIDVLNLDASTISIGDFEFEVINNRTVLKPTSDLVGEVGTSSNRLNVVNTQTAAIDVIQAESGDLGEVGRENIEIDNIGSSETSLAPSSDGTCQLGYSGKNYSSVWAKEFIDSGTTVAGDGGDPLAGLAEAVEPPEQCRVCDGDGNTEGISISSLTEELWSICTAQQRRIEDLETRLSDLEAQQ